MLKTQVILTFGERKLDFLPCRLRFTKLYPSIALHVGKKLNMNKNYSKLKIKFE